MSKLENSLAQGWRQRLAALETELNARPDGAFAWHAHVEAKFLRFLLSRYPDGRGTPTPNSPEVFVSPLAVIASPKVRPIKRERMKLLRHITRENAAAGELALSSSELIYRYYDRYLEAQLYRRSLRRQQDARRKIGGEDRRRLLIQSLRNQKW